MYYALFKKIWSNLVISSKVRNRYFETLFQSSSRSESEISAAQP